MGGIFYGFFNKLPFNRLGSELFLVLDIGTFSVKALLVEGKESKVTILAHANKPYLTDICSENGLDISRIAKTCKSVLDELRAAGHKGRDFPKRVILGIGGGFLHGRTLTQNYIREYPTDEIEIGELTNIIQRVQQRTYDQIRRDFSKDTGRPELDMRLLSSAICEIKIDGYHIVNPLGFQGKEVVMSLFNAYASKVYIDGFEKLINELKLDLISIISEPYWVFNLVSKYDPLNSDVIFIDIGGSATEISLVRRGKLEDVKAIAVGASSFTKRISKNLKINLDEAENIKLNFVRGGVSASIAQKINKMIIPDTKLFIEALRIVFMEFSQASLLPSRIYIYGGGAYIDAIKQVLKQRKWRENLSFLSQPQIALLTISSKDKNNIFSSSPDILKSALWTTPISLVEFYTHQFGKGDDMLKILRRSMRLIQS